MQKTSSIKTKKNISPKVKALFLDIEKFRLERLNEFYFRLPLALIIGGIALYIAYPHVIKASQTDAIDEIIGIIGLGIFGLWYFASQPIRDYKAYYKNKIMPIIIKSFGGNNYKAKGRCVDFLALNNSSIVPNFDYEKSEDYFQNKIGKIDLEFCELKLMEHSSNRGLTYRGYNKDYTKFKGAAIVLHMPFQFAAETVVSKDLGAVFNFVSSKLKGKESIKLENPIFEKLFEVVSDDQQNARYLLTPVMMEEIIKLYELFKYQANCSSLACEFKSDRVLFMIKYPKNLIEPANLFTSAYNFQKLSLVKKELQIITNIVKQLNLDYLVDRKLAYKKVNAPKGKMPRGNIVSPLDEFKK